MLKVGFLGAGRMAQALAKGLITAGVIKGEHIIASCALKDQQCTSAFESLGAKITYDNPKVVDGRDVLIVCTKPDKVHKVLEETKDVITNQSLLISLAMGVSIEQLEKNLPKGARVIRAMPNTPALIRSGATVFVRGSAATEDDAKKTQRLFEAVGTCEEVPENFLDAVTSLSGAGPAYVYIFIEALADGAVRMGLPRDLAYRLAAQTVVGAGRMVLETNEHPGQLKDNVTSPGGTAASGIYALEKNGFRRAIIEAIEVGTNKSKETLQGQRGTWLDGSLGKTDS